MAIPIFDKIERITTFDDYLNVKRYILSKNEYFLDTLIHNASTVFAQDVLLQIEQERNNAALEKAVNDDNTLEIIYFLELGAYISKKEIKILLDNGNIRVLKLIPDINFNMYSDALYSAVENSYLDVVSSLVQHPKFNEKNLNLSYYLALKNKDRCIVRFFDEKFPCY